MATQVRAKRAYHHGDLRNALISAAIKLAAGGGPESVTVRAAARAVDVTPTAAYRHFSGHDELLAAVSKYALDELVAAMQKEVASRPASSDPVHNALTRFAALGRGYITFARAEPGLFRTVYSTRQPLQDNDEDTKTDKDPYGLLLLAIDELVAVGYLTEERRHGADVAAWAMAHGLADLLDGPLRNVPTEEQDELIIQSLLILGHGIPGTGMTTDQETYLAQELSTPR